MARYDDLLEELDIVLEDDSDFAMDKAKGGPVARYFVADHQAVQTIHHMKDLMRATADLLEMEAARLRHELDLLDMNADRATLH